MGACVKSIARQKNDAIENQRDSDYHKCGRRGSTNRRTILLLCSLIWPLEAEEPSRCHRLDVELRNLHLRPREQDSFFRLIGLPPGLSCATRGGPPRNRGPTGTEPRRNRNGTAEEPRSIQHIENQKSPRGIYIFCKGRPPWARFK